MSKYYNLILGAIVFILCLALHMSILFLPLALGIKLGLLVGLDIIAFVAHQLDNLIQEDSHKND